MKKLQALPWSTVAVLGILGILNLFGRDSTITWAIMAIVGAYVGLDLAGFVQRRGPKGGS